MEPEAQKQEDNSTNSVVGVQPSNATEIESTEDSDSTTKTQIPRMSELSGEAKAVEPEEDCVIDAKRDGQSSSSGGGESGRAEDSDSTPKTQIPQTSEPSGEEQEAKAVEPEEDCVIDVKSDGQSSSGGGGESWRAEKVCRICHLSPENSSDNSELIQLGCGCKAELGSSHLHCAETWFKHKGNR